jgi:signal transduction histidine kinase
MPINSENNNISDVTRYRFILECLFLGTGPLLIEEEPSVQKHKSTKSTDESDSDIHGSADTTIANTTSTPSDTPGNTSIIKGRKRALQEAYSRSLTAKHSYYCVTGQELAKSYKPFLPLLKATVQHGGSSRIITNIEEETIPAVKELSEAGGQVRHIDSSSLRRCVIFDNTVAYFSIVEEPIITAEAIENVSQTEGEDLWISSTESSVIQSAKRRFLSDWKENTISATERINKLERGIEPEFFKVITDTEQAGQILLHLAQSVRKEALSLIPNSRGMLRMERLGVIDSLIQASKRGAFVKIICPISEENSHIARRISEQAPEIRVMNAYGDAQSGITIVDSEKLFQAEVKNPEAHTFLEAIGFAIYSNTKRNVTFFKSFFELLWNERVLNEELKRADIMQKEFINAAAHELRNPIQPILTLSDVLSSRVDDDKNRELISVISRNAKRLHKLAENILDVTRIESNNLNIRKEQLNFDELISSIVKDYQKQLQESSRKIELIYNNLAGDLVVEADRNRMLQVICNLLDNSVKFTKEGKIMLNIQRKDNGHVEVGIKDTGVGIDPDMYQRLFKKFASKSFEGTGLGLFISKSIIEAHGGKIRGVNNTDGRGATFYFSLPLQKVKV